MGFNVVIPARYASSRLPAKPLLDIAGKPMVIHVVERALKSGADHVVVATDHPEIERVVRDFNFQVVMTDSNHASGTDRIAEVVTLMNWTDETLVVNVQGDEPLIDPALIRDVALNLSQHELASVSTACHRIFGKTEMMNPNIVKVVFDDFGYAIYFSRAPIPYPRDAFMAGKDVPDSVEVFRHVGIYAYKTSFLKQYAELKPSAIEKAESLEQLRVISHGYKISVAVTNNAPASGVDTLEDLEFVRSCFI